MLVFFDPGGEEPVERFDEKQGVGGIARYLFMENGVCLRASGDAIICAPPFTLSHSEADTIIEVTRKVLDQTQKIVNG